MSMWLYTEELGREQFYIADTAKGLRFVVLDKHGIGNVFTEMAEVFRYMQGELNDCERECIEPYDTGIEGVDFLDDYFGIKG